MTSQLIVRCLAFSLCAPRVPQDPSQKQTMQDEINELGQPVRFAIPDWSPPEFPSEEPMQGRFCRIERFDPQRHQQSLHAANSLDGSGAMWTYLPYGPFDSEEIYQRWIGEVGSGKDPLLHAIIDLKTGRAVGVASYLNIHPGNGSIEVGHLGFSPLLRRTPAATEAMFLMMDRAFSLGYRRYEWKCNALNEASKAAALRLGFTFEGIFRQAAVVKGRNRDTAWFSIIDREWPPLRKRLTAWLAAENFDEHGVQRRRLSEMI